MKATNPIEDDLGKLLGFFFLRRQISYPFFLITWKPITFTQLILLDQRCQRNLGSRRVRTGFHFFK